MNTDIKPRSKWISGAYLAAEAVGGGVAGSASAFAGGSAVHWLWMLANPGRRDEWFGGLIFTILGVTLGYIIGASIGVYLIGRWLNGRDGIRTESGAYLLALLGSIVGAGLAFYLLMRLAPVPGENPALVWATPVIVSIVAAIVPAFLFNLSVKARA